MRYHRKGMKIKMIVLVVVVMMMMMHTYHSFLCTLHFLQSKCTCELFAHPLGLNNEHMTFALCTAQESIIFYALVDSKNNENVQFGVRQYSISLRDAVIYVLAEFVC